MLKVYILRQLIFRNCNLNFFQRELRVPVIFHNNKNYDLHLYLLDLLKMSDDVTIIAENLEKFKYVSTERFMFLDSFAFLSSSLDQLVSSLRARGKFGYLRIKITCLKNHNMKCKFANVNTFPFQGLFIPS